MSERSLSSDGLDANLGSPQKLAYERSPSPDYAFCNQILPVERTGSPFSQHCPSPSLSLSSSSIDSSPSPPPSPLSSSSILRSPASPEEQFEVNVGRLPVRSPSHSPDYRSASPSCLHSEPDGTRQPSDYCSDVAALERTSPSHIAHSETDKHLRPLNELPSQRRHEEWIANSTYGNSENYKTNSGDEQWNCTSRTKRPWYNFSSVCSVTGRNPSADLSSEIFSVNSSGSCPKKPQSIGSQSATCLHQSNKQQRVSQTCHETSSYYSMDDDSSSCSIYNSPRSVHSDHLSPARISPYPHDPAIDTNHNSNNNVHSPMDARVHSPMDARVHSPVDARVHSPMDASVHSPMDATSVSSNFSMTDSVSGEANSCKNKHSLLTSCDVPVDLSSNASLLCSTDALVSVRKPLEGAESTPLPPPPPYSCSVNPSRNTTDSLPSEIPLNDAETQIFAGSESRKRPLPVSGNQSHICGSKSSVLRKCPTLLPLSDSAAFRHNPATASQDKVTEKVKVEPSHEVVDVDNDPPCIVDLTSEDDDDDDVEIVSTEQPVVFLGAEPPLPPNRRGSRKLRNNSSRASSASETIVISDSAADEAGSSSSTAIYIPDGNNSVCSEQNVPVRLGASDQRNPVVFGDLLNQSVIPVDSDCEPRRMNEGSRNSNMVAFSAFSLRDNHSRHTGESERSRDNSNRSRSRSPLNNHQRLLKLRTPESLFEAPIPQDVLDDIASIYAEKQRICRRVIAAPNILSETSFINAASGICMLSSFSQSVPPQAPQPSTSSSSSSSSSSSNSEDSGALSCPICFESFHDIKKSGMSLSSTVCGHIFCTDCLEASLRTAKFCPTCRKRLNKKQYHPLYI